MYIRYSKFMDLETVWKTEWEDWVQDRDDCRTVTVVAKILIELQSQEKNKGTQKLKKNLFKNVHIFYVITILKFSSVILVFHLQFLMRFQHISIITFFLHESITNNSLQIHKYINTKWTTLDTNVNWNIACNK